MTAMLEAVLLLGNDPISGTLPLYVWFFWDSGDHAPCLTGALRPLPRLPLSGTADMSMPKFAAFPRRRFLPASPLF